MREAFRLNKHILISWLKENNQSIVVFFMYQNAEIQPFLKIKTDFITLFDKLMTNNHIK